MERHTPTKISVAEAGKLARTAPRIVNEYVAAERLGLQPSTLRAWRMRGKGPAFLRMQGRSIRYRITDIDDFLEKSVVSMGGGQ